MMPSTGVAPRRRDVRSIERATFGTSCQISSRDKSLEFRRDVGYAPTVMADNEITLGTVMEHLHAMEDRINKRFDGVDSCLTRIDGTLDRMERNLTRQIDGIDKRLDEIEIAKLPQRVTRIEERLELAA